MQFAKDSFFLALQQRLAGLNPGRTVTLNGATVPALLVPENLPPSSAEPQPNTFYIEWGAAGVVDGHAGDAALMSLECVISYAQVVVAFVDREGGSFFQEWSALFVVEAESGGRVCFYYPRLSPNPGAGASGATTKSGAGIKTSKGASVKNGNATAVAARSSAGSSSQKFSREEFSEIQKPLMSVGLHASFVALPFTDTNDGQAVSCYRSYFPAAMAAVY